MLKHRAVFDLYRVHLYPALKHRATDGGAVTFFAINTSNCRNGYCPVFVICVETPGCVNPLTDNSRVRSTQTNNTMLCHARTPKIGVQCESVIIQPLIQCCIKPIAQITHIPYYLITLLPYYLITPPVNRSK